MTVSTVADRVQQQILKLSQIWFTIISKCMRMSLRELTSWSCSFEINHPPSWRQQSGDRPTVQTAANVFQKLCYENKDALSAGIIVAGWDKEVGPSVYNIPLGGGLFRQPWAIGGKYTPSKSLVIVLSLSPGSGSTYVYGYCDATYKDGWGRDETVNFVRNSKPHHS